uniref:C2H2-type domain-containing protein n=1 Tax=Cannabis sativa TaxID=3483 RepID=A0A803PAD4_CANSA
MHIMARSTERFSSNMNGWFGTTTAHILHHDPDAEVVALSPKTLMATNRFVCEICNKGFQRDQNLQLHRRGHNLPWKLRQRTNKDQLKKKVYICPEKSCVHHDPGRALGDLTGIKKHFSRKHGEKKWKCDKCSKKYAVQSDWKAHSKTCGTREYKCVMMIMNPSSSSATNSHVNVATTMAHHYDHHGYLDGSNLMRSLGSNISLSSSNIKGIENGGLTRDFLGSGSGVVMAQRKLLSHNSCGSSAMGLSQFSGNH